MSTEINTGTVKFYNSKNGFGFITTDQGDLFFHITECNGFDPKEGDSVEFIVGEGKRGPCAKEVKVV